MNTELEERAKTMVCQVFLGGDTSLPIEADASLVESGICDSLGLVQLAAAIETEFPGIRIQDQDITRETLGSVATIVRLLERLGVRG